MIWSELLNLALLGGERSQIPPALKTKLEVEGIRTDADFSAVLLESVALYNQVRKAAFPLVAYKGELPKAIIEEKGLVCSPRSIDHLKNIIKGRYAPALAEFIAHLRKNDKKLPTGYLPDLFSVSLKDKKLWALLHPVIGQKGEWLLRQIQDWKLLVDEVDDGKWNTGTPEERLAVLQYWRKQNPPKAIEALEVTWDKETLTEKYLFLKKIALNITQKDESFLEARLSDKQKKIRMEAALLLSKIGTSDLIDRLFTELLKHIHVNENVIEFELPEDLPNMTRDGIYPIPKKGVMGGMKAAWLRQIISKIPPQKWEELLEKEAEECLNLFAKSRWADQIFPALAGASVWHGNENWQMTMLSHLHENGNRFDTPVLSLKKMIDQLSADAFMELSETMLEAAPRVIEDKSVFLLLLTESQHPWTDKLTMQVIGRFQAWMRNVKDDFLGIAHYRQLLESAAYTANPHLLDKLKLDWPVKSTIWYYWEDTVDKFVRTLAFRREMQKELAK